MGSCLRYPVLDKNPEKHTLAGRTSPLRPYKGVPPPRALMPIGTMINLTVVSIPFAVNLSLSHLFPKRHKLDLSVR